MKRHDALVQFSHEHHHGLRWARQFYDLPGDASRETRSALLAEFFPTWYREINPHFRREEDVLLPVFATEADPDAECIREMLQQHVHIRKAVLQLEIAPSLEIMHNLGNLLQEHIRLEERAVFPLVEESLSPESLDIIQSRIE